MPSINTCVESGFMSMAGMSDLLSLMEGKNENKDIQDEQDEQDEKDEKWLLSSWVREVLR